MEKLLENEAPLVTLVNMIGAFEANPISTYTRKFEEIIQRMLTLEAQFCYIFCLSLNIVFTYYEDPC